MNEKEKKKLCWNCEGSVLRHLETCPFCGVYLSPSEQDLLSPPYPPQEGKDSFDPVYESDQEAPHEEALSLPEEAQGSKTELYTLLALLSGTSFLIFGLAVWLFSDKGRLTLSWSQDVAPFYLSMSLALLGIAFYLARK